MLKKDFYIFAFLIFLCLFLLWGRNQGWLRPVRLVLEKPVLVAQEKIYSFKNNLFSETQKSLLLEAQLRQLAVEQNQLQTCLEENEKMRRLLGAPLPARWQFLPALVIGVSGEMIINQGEKQGVKEGMMVVFENILVGRVTRVHQESSVVQLPTSPESKIPVMVKQPVGPSPKASGIQARGLLLSAPGGKLILDRVLQEEDIQKGDLVVSGGEVMPARPAGGPDTGQGWLPDLVIGQIDQVLSKPAEIYKKARVRPLVDYSSLRIVFVVIKT